MTASAARCVLTVSAVTERSKATAFKDIRQMIATKTDFIFNSFVSVEAVV
jgi:hypothetical protein